jgi:hypothetical protein
MAPIDDKVLEKLLKRHLSSRLDGQLGRAEAAFRQNLADRSADAVDSLGNTDTDRSSPSLRLVHAAAEPRNSFAGRGVARPRWGGMGWFLGVAGTAVAASLATLLLMPHVGVFRPSPPETKTQIADSNPTPTNPGTKAPEPFGSEEHPIVRYVHNSAWDEGTVTPDESGMPMRRVRYQQVERVQYFDPQRNAVVEVVVPRENVQHYEVDSY